MKPPLAVTLYHSRRGVLLLAGSLGFYDGEWREGISLIKWSLESRHSKPVSEPAMKELARLKPRCGFRHPVAGRESGAGFAFALLGLRSHSRHSHPLRMNFQSSELAHEEPVAELPPSPCFRAADTSFARRNATRPRLADSCPALCAMRCGIRPKKNRTVARSVNPPDYGLAFISTLAGFVSVKIFLARNCDLRATYPDWRGARKRNLYAYPRRGHLIIRRVWRLNA